MQDFESLSKEELIQVLKKILAEQQTEKETKLLMLHRQEEIYHFYDRYKVISKISKEGLWELRIPEHFTADTPVWYSDEFIRMLGFDREEFAPTLDAFTQLLHPEQKKTFLSDRIQFLHYYTICTIEYFLGLIVDKYLSKSTQLIM
jgi:hypothetical protein